MRPRRGSRRPRRRWRQRSSECGWDRLDPKRRCRSRPQARLRPGEWNQFEIFLNANIQVWLNDVNVRGLAGGVPEDMAGLYGPLALYVGGTGEVRFKDIAYRDAQTRLAPAERVSSRFRMQRLSEFYYAWSAAAADFNHDGVSGHRCGASYLLRAQLHDVARDLRDARQ